MPLKAKPARAGAARRLPRASGGPPAPGRLWGQMPGAPPRERGSTHQRLPQGRSVLGSPARAGVHPVPGRSRSRGRRLPRASGGPPIHCQTSLQRSWAPPRERGSTLEALQKRLADAGSPARAGVHLSGAKAAAVPLRLPRASGGPPTWRTDSMRWSWAPPRERGSTLRRTEVGTSAEGSPARAGVHPKCASTVESFPRLPRASGGPTADPFFWEARGQAEPGDQGIEMGTRRHHQARGAGFERRLPRCICPPIHRWCLKSPNPTGAPSAGGGSGLRPLSPSPPGPSCPQPFSPSAAGGSGLQPPTPSPAGPSCPQPFSPSAAGRIWSSTPQPITTRAIWSSASDVIWNSDRPDRRAGAQRRVPRLDHSSVSSGGPSGVSPPSVFAVRRCATPSMMR